MIHAEDILFGVIGFAAVYMMMEVIEIVKTRFSLRKRSQES